jgi:hypothetical protein
MTAHFKGHKQNKQKLERCIFDNKTGNGTIIIHNVKKSVTATMSQLY